MFILTSDLKKETSEINSALYLVVVIPNYMNEKYETYYVEYTQILQDNIYKGIKPDF